MRTTLTTPRGRAFFAFVLAVCLTGTALAAPEVPAHNHPRVSANPPPRPPAGDASAKAARLLEAIKQDDASLIADFFLPREAFAQIKAIANPDRRWNVLYRAYVEDIHALHTSLRGIEHATFDRFELARRGSWQPIGSEGNRLPYYASRHSLLHYRVDGRPRSFEVRVLITWDDSWYITHLSEFQNR